MEDRYCITCGRHFIGSSNPGNCSIDPNKCYECLKKLDQQNEQKIQINENNITPLPNNKHINFAINLVDYQRCRKEILKYFGCHENLQYNIRDYRDQYWFTDPECLYISNNRSALQNYKNANKDHEDEINNFETYARATSSKAIWIFREEHYTAINVYTYMSYDDENIEIFILDNEKEIKKVEND